MYSSDGVTLLQDVNHFTRFAGPVPFAPLDDNGAAMPGATLKVYLSRTKIVVAQGTADGSGVFAAIPMSTSLTYRVVLKNADGALVYDVDPYPGTGVSIAGGGGKTKSPVLVAGRNINGSNFNYMTSADGISWTLRNNPSMVAVRAIAFSPELGLFVAVGWSVGPGSKIQTSPDGIVWTDRTAPSASRWNDVCWSSQRARFVAVAIDGGANSVATSPDGITWTLQTTPNQIFGAVRYLPSAGLFAAGGSAPAAFNPNAMMTSPDGFTWTLQAVPFIGAFACQTHQMGVSDDKFLSTNRSEAKMMTSPDGITWTLTNDNIGGQSGAAFGEGIVVVINPGGAGSCHYEYSIDDAATLILGPLMSATLAGGEAVAYADALGMFVSSGMGNINGKNANYSLDGINWTDGVTPLLAADNAWYCLCVGEALPFDPTTLDVLLVHCNGTNGSTAFADATPYAHVVTAAGAAAVSTLAPKFGSGAVLVPGGGSSWLSIPIDAALDLSNTTFTVQFWFKPSAAAIASSTGELLIGCRNNINTTGFTIGYTGTSGQITAQMFGGGSSVTNTPPTLVAGQWYHLAYVYDGVQFQLYIDGIGTSPAAVAGPFLAFNNADLRIGADFFSGFIGSCWNGEIDEVRVTRYPLYLSNFTPPSVPFPP
jgi:Concanavalin A-like lectin/glucanases superfamily